MDHIGFTGTQNLNDAAWSTMVVTFSMSSGQARATCHIQQSNIQYRYIAFFNTDSCIDRGRSSCFSPGAALAWFTLRTAMASNFRSETIHVVTRLAWSVVGYGERGWFGGTLLCVNYSSAGSGFVWVGETFLAWKSSKINKAKSLFQKNIFFQSTSHDLTPKGSLVGKGNPIWFVPDYMGFLHAECHTMGVRWPSLAITFSEYDAASHEAGNHGKFQMHAWRSCQVDHFSGQCSKEVLPCWTKLYNKSAVQKCTSKHPHARLQKEWNCLSANRLMQCFDRMCNQRKCRSKFSIHEGCQLPLKHHD